MSPAPSTSLSLPGLRVFRPADPVSAHPPSRMERAVTVLLVTFLLVFPKGGIKLGGVPVTWGYIALALAFTWFPAALWFGRAGKVRTVRLLALAALVPFQAVVWLALLTNGTEGMGFTISLLVTFFFIPTMLVLVLGVHLDRIHLGHLFGLVRHGVLLVAAYGIFLWVYKWVTGEFVEIPYLTVNAGDLGELENKFIDRGGVFKLISTYNNGNIYGVSILTLLPLYTWLERSTLRVSVVKLSLLLTLSRTVWAGLIVYEVVHRLYVRRVSARTVATLLAALGLLAVGVWHAVGLIGVDPAAFLLDRNLGGRFGQTEALESAGALPGVPFEHIREIVYLSVLENFGVVGLVAFLLAMAAPLAAHLAGVLPGAETPYKRSLASGLMVYLVVAMSDGALLFIPVMVFYWFVASLLLSDNPSFADVHAA